MSKSKLGRFERSASVLFFSSPFEPSQRMVGSKRKCQALRGPPRAPHRTREDLEVFGGDGSPYPSGGFDFCLVSVCRLVLVSRFVFVCGSADAVGMLSARRQATVYRGWWMEAGSARL